MFRIVSMEPFAVWLDESTEVIPLASAARSLLHFGCRCCDPRELLHLMLESGPRRGPDHEAIEVHGRADHRHPA